MDVIAHNVHTSIKEGEAKHSSTDIIDALCLLFPDHMRGMTIFLPEKSKQRNAELDTKLLLLYTEHGPGFTRIFLDTLFAHAFKKEKNAAKHYFLAPLQKRHEGIREAARVSELLSNSRSSIIVLESIAIPFQKNMNVASVFNDFFGPYLNNKGVKKHLYLTDMLSLIALKLRKQLFHETFKEMCKCVSREEKGLHNSLDIWLCAVDMRRELVLTPDKKGLCSPRKNLEYDNSLIRDNQKLRNEDTARADSTK